MMSRIENGDAGRTDAPAANFSVDLSKDQLANKAVDRVGTQQSPVSDGRMQFTNIYSECCIGVDRSQGPANRNERTERQGAPVDPKWGAARERLGRSESQKNEIRENGYRAIQYGDTLSDIAKANLELKNGGKPVSGAEVWKEVERLAKVNNLDPRKNIRPGTKIYMEDCDKNRPSTGEKKPDGTTPGRQPDGRAPGKPELTGPKSDVNAGPKQDVHSPKPEVNAGPKPDVRTGPHSDLNNNPKPNTEDKPNAPKENLPAQSDAKPISPKDKIPGGSNDDVSITTTPHESNHQDIAPQNRPNGGDSEPTNFSPDGPSDEERRKRESERVRIHEENQRREEELKEREHALKAREDELKKREEVLKQLEERLLEEHRRKEQERSCDTKSDTNPYEH